MKTLINILMLFIFYPTSLLPQFYSDIEPSQYALDFFQLAEESIHSFVESVDLQKKFNDDEIQHIATLYYNAMLEDPVGFKMHQRKKYNEWKSNMIKSNYTSKELKPATKKAMLIEIVRDKYGDDFTEILKLPALVRGKVIKKELVDFIGDDEKTKTKQMKITLIVEDVIKGEKYFNKDDQITVSYLPFWFQDLYVDFKPGNSYLIPLRPWIGLREYRGEIAVDLLPFDDYGIYSVSNDIPITDGKCYELSEFSSYAEFKQSFYNTYMIFGR